MVCNSHRRCFADYFFVQISGVAMNIIELAKQAGFSDADDKGVWITDGYWDKELKAFAKLVAAHEREECAKACEDLDAWNMDDPASTAVTAIRARGTT